MQTQASEVAPIGPLELPDCGSTDSSTGLLMTLSDMLI